MADRCKNCNCELENQKTYCSKECQGEYEKKRETLVCENCGKNFEVIKSRSDVRKNCSEECYRESLEEKMSGEGNPFYGESHSEETREKISNRTKGRSPWNEGRNHLSKEKNPMWKGGKVEVTCEWCGEDYKVTPAIVEKTRFCSEKCSDEWKKSKYPKGGLNHVWKGGISKDPYPFEFDEELKNEVRSRFHKRCVICGIRQIIHKEIYNKCLSIHHIDYDKENISLNNLVPLCQSCHGQTNYNRDYWKRELSLLMKDYEVVGFLNPFNFMSFSNELA